MKTLCSFILLIISIQLAAQNSVELIGTLDPVYPFSGINSSQYGRYVAVLGDINGDGFDDWAVACDNSADFGTGAFQTKVYIYVGSRSIKANQLPNLTIASNDKFFYSGNYIASAGDFNGDGLMDFMVCYNTHVDVFFGRKHLPQVPDILIKTEQLGVDNITYISSAGDVNNDGFDDILISSYKQINLILGNNKAEVIEGCTYQLIKEKGYSTISKGIGDINGDGFSDYVIADEDEIRFYLGGATCSTMPYFIIEKSKFLYDYYLDIQANFDYNNDGFGDFVIKNGYYDSDSIYKESYHLFSGKNFPSDQPDHVLEKSRLWSVGDLNNDGFDDFLTKELFNSYEIVYGGKVLATKKITLDGDYREFYGMSDFNNDGNTDILASNYTSSQFGSYTGLVTVFLKSNTVNLQSNLFYHGAVGLYRFGTTSTGDFNGDGINDILIRHGWDNLKYQLFLGGKDIQPSPSMEITKEDNPLLSFYFDMSGDINGDGFADIVATNFYRNLFQVFYGNSTLDNKNKVVVASNAQSFGSSVSSGGDFNGDGYDDIIIGAERAKANGISPGQAFLYLGGPKIDTIPSLIFTGETDREQFGNVVKFVGDLNNDGYDDIAIGANRYERDDYPYGRVYIFFGGSNPNNQPDLIFEPEHSPLFSISLASAGDVNNDGYGDLLISGAYSGNNPAMQSHVYLLLGGSDMDTRPDLVFPKKYPWLSFGMHLSSAGDLNGDGFDDILISGGDGNNVSIYFGGEVMDNEADYIIENRSGSWDGFGTDFSLLGDINANGRTELVISAPSSNACGLSNGRCYIYSLHFDNIQTITDNVYGFYHYRNHISNEIMIVYQLNENSNVEINLYNINGILVEKITNSFQVGGIHQLFWNPKTKTPGIYILNIKSNASFLSRKIALGL